MRGMTGFGHVERRTVNLVIVVDVKTVNGRFLDMNVRLPRELAGFEQEARAAVQSRMARGRVDLFVNTTALSGEPEIDQAALDAYLKLAARLNERGVPGALDIATLLQLPGVSSPRQLDHLSDEDQAALRGAIAESLDQAQRARSAEGAALKKDLVGRITRLADIAETVAARAPEVREFYLARLKQRIADAGMAQTMDENRLTQELIYYCERSDVTEEITRLRAHMERFRHFLSRPEAENVGKQLDFLCQEMNREVNTIMSKSPLAGISELGVDAKAEVEKIREQVQNVE